MFYRSADNRTYTRTNVETNDRVNSHEFYKINKYPPPQISSPPSRGRPLEGDLSKETSTTT
jgi:hypothetical protein